MDKWTNAIGIDVSKETLDAFDYVYKIHIQVSNTLTGFKELLKWAKRKNEDIQQVLFCYEHTGLYSLPLAIFMSEQQLFYAMVPGLEIKYSLGLTRGKNDQVDARRIAEYAYLRREKITVYTLPSNRLLELKSLLSLREKMASQRAGYQQSKNEMKSFLKLVKTSPFIIEAQEKLIKELTNQIQEIEKQMKEIIQADENLKKNYELATSVKGVGLILGTTMLVYTNCFTSFKDWRKFASYSGIAPFDHQSGSSIKGAKKVHHFANKRIKGLLSNAATCAIQYCPEMKLYYQKRLNEGKNKMSTQNIIRNKIVSRIFAVVQRGTPYVDTLKYAA
jgi:transposase